MKLQVKCYCTEMKWKTIHGQEVNACGWCGDFFHVRMIPSPTEEKEPLPFVEIKKAFLTLQSSISCVVSDRNHVVDVYDSYPAGYRAPTSRESRLWCAPCLEVLHDRIKARKRTKIEGDEK